MTVEEKQEAQSAIQDAIQKFHTVKKAMLLSLRNYVAGTVSLDPTLKQLYTIGMLNVREELEAILEKYAVNSDVPELVHAKIVGIYTECLQLLRAYENSQSSRVFNNLTYLVEYEQQLALAKEIDDSKLIAEEFFEDITTNTLEDPIE